MSSKPYRHFIALLLVLFCSRFEAQAEDLFAKTDSTLQQYLIRCKAQIKDPDFLQTNDTLTRMAQEKNDKRMIPQIFLQEVEPGKNFFINHTEIIPFQVMHGRLPILGYRIGKRLAYITDMLTMPEESYEQLQDLDVLVVNALRVKPHPTHQSISEALETAKRIGARETYFIHMSHHAGLHVELEKQLPPDVHLTFDGMEIEF